MIPGEPERSLSRREFCRALSAAPGLLPARHPAADLLFVDLGHTPWPGLEIKAGEWERYQIAAGPRQAVVAGSDTRGLVFGMYQLSQPGGALPDPRGAARGAAVVTRRGRYPRRAGPRVLALLVLAGAAASGVVSARQDRPEPAPPSPELSTIEYLRRAYRDSRPALEPPARAELLPAWRDRAAERLRASLGLDRCTPAPLAPRVIARAARPGYRLERIVFTSEPHVDVPALLLVPDGVSAARPAPAVLCLHGSVPGAKDEIAGELDGAQAAAGFERYRDDYARQFARLGFVALAIDLRDWGEREPAGSPPATGGTSWRDAASVLAALVGKSYAGLSVFDALRALDYLETRPEVARGAIGCAGFSSGASLTAWVATLDRRVRVAGMSGYFGSWRRLAGERDRLWTATSIMPGFLVDLDIHLTLASVAPTPLVVAFEHRDRPAEIQPDVDLVRGVYRGFRAESDLAIELLPGGHVWHGDIVVPWMAKRLEALR